MKNYYRIGVTNEGKLLQENSTTYYGIVLQGNFTALYKNWLTVFLQKLKKPFFVDPRTEVFGLDLNNIKKDNDFRVSFQKLIDHFDKSSNSKYFSKKINEGKLSPDDFIISKKWNTELINVLTNGVFSLQKNILNLDTSSNKKSIKKYLKILEELEVDEDQINRVEFIVAPYFHFSNTYSPWFKINVKLFNEMINKAKDYDVYCILCFDHEVLESTDEIQRIIKNYENTKGFLVWINNFYEIKADANILKNYYNFMKELKKTQKPVINLYGGYYTLSISKNINIDGYSRGISIGEGRDVETPATGGGSPNRYYLQLVHNFMVEEIAIKVLGRNPDLRCKCDICAPLFNEIIKKIKPANDQVLALEFINRLKPQKFKAHFMHVHNSEIKKNFKEDFDVKKELKKEIDEVDSKKLKELDVKTAHLDRWLKSL